MQLARHFAIVGDLKRQIAELTGERDAARRVVATQADRIRSDGQKIAYLTDERDQADMAHRAALADLAELTRQLADERAAALDLDLAEPPTAILRGEPDMERYG
ncbi:hypothetical protein SEA_NIKLAS_48 [Mycobacterium Phage Niklas]|uniref:Uncharacterized protein n=1 Tax=Mycobacterium Phage Niklas TaxID=2517936 RepID=A0A482JCK7_9CAUD|nr:hypothetical protein I5H04_gp55 [Mycobacterium Phage Niklas]ASR85932.1 hypothetical protein SEA_PEANAM_48 [Mycobacterium phage Peanam]QAY02779.1 hypothetical protein SEA_SHAOBING_48 [Mycobacterium phage Shaobing]QBP31630.1 hypothetical protein SEA_NIKLAS_48 [Mycobacterium Phage Niklas]